MKHKQAQVKNKVSIQKHMLRIILFFIEYFLVYLFGLAYFFFQFQVWFGGMTLLLIYFSFFIKMPTSILFFYV